MVMAQPIARQGVLDLRDHDFESNPTFELSGDWEIYLSQFYNSSNFDTATSWLKSKALYVPSTLDWSEYPQLHDGYKQFGFATMRLRVLMPDSFPKQALMIRDARTAFKIYINGKGFEGAGEVSQTAYNSNPDWRNTSKGAEFNPGVNEVILLISNFHHGRGGLVDPIVMGTSETVFYSRNLEIGGVLFLTGCLLLAGIFALGLFWFKTSDVVGLFFFLFCGFFALFIINSGPHLLSSLFRDMEWNFSLRLMWISFYASIISYGYFLLANFRERLRPAVFHIITAMSAIMIILTAFTAPHFFTMIQIYYFGFLLLAVLGITMGALLQANFGHKLAWVNTLGTIALFAVVGHQILSYLDFTIYWPMFYVGGLALFIFSQAVVMAIKFGRNYRDSSLAALAAAKTRDEFLNAMSHELKTPMNAILGMSSFLEKSELNSNQRDKLKAIRQNGESLMSMINDVLSISELDSGQLKLKNAVLDLEGAIKSAINLSKQHLKKKSVKFKYYIDPEIPELLMGDASRIKQVLIHLLNNAFKFTDKGEVLLKATHVENVNGFSRVHFSLKDTGVGMKLRAKSSLSIFTLNKPGKSNKFHGNGLGLSVTADLLEKMGGMLSIKSKRYVGTEVSFDLVLEEYQAKPEPATSIFKKNEIDTNLKILYAEDNPVNQKLMILMLNAMGLNADIANNGEEAVKMAMQKYYNIILMDIQMPVMDGLEASTRIVEHSNARPIIIATTANLAEVDKRKCFAVGMNDFLTKPLSQEDLKLAILKWQGLKEYLDDSTGAVIKLSS